MINLLYCKYLFDYFLADKVNAMRIIYLLVVLILITFTIGLLFAKNEEVSAFGKYINKLR